MKAGLFLLSPLAVLGLASGCKGIPGMSPAPKPAASPAPARAAESKPERSALPPPEKRNRILFSAQPLGSAEAPTLEAWTLGEPLYMHAYGPAPRNSVLYAEVNGELALGAGADIVPGGGLGGLAEVTLEGDGKLVAVEGSIGPYQSGMHFGKPSAHYAGVWAVKPPGWARAWEEFHKRLIPMMRVGNNTLKIWLSDEKREATYAEGTLTVRIPDEAAFKAELRQNVAAPAEGDKATLKELDAQLRKRKQFDPAKVQIRSIQYATGKWKAELDKKGREVSRSTPIDVIWRNIDDPFPARCRLVGFTAVRSSEAGPSAKAELTSTTVETRWTPCP